MAYSLVAKWGRQRTSITCDELTLVGLHRYKTELRRIQESLKDEMERDVTKLKSALRQYDDQVQRLECQKQLLLKQVEGRRVFTNSIAVGLGATVFRPPIAHST